MSSEKGPSGRNPLKFQKNPFGVKVMGMGEKKPSSSLISFGVGVLNDLHIVKTCAPEMPSSVPETLSSKDVVEEQFNNPCREMIVYIPPVSSCVTIPLKTVFPIPDSPEPATTDTRVNVDEQIEVSSDATLSNEVPLKRKVSAKTPAAIVPPESEDSENVPLASIARNLKKRVRDEADEVASLKKTKDGSGPSSSRKKLSIDVSSKKRTSQRIRSAGLKGKDSAANNVIDLDVEKTVVEDDALDIRSSVRKVKKKSAESSAKKGKAPIVESHVNEDVQDIRTPEKKKKSAVKIVKGSRSTPKRKKSSKLGESSIVIFHTQGSRDRWPLVTKRRIPVERPLGPDVRECEEVMVLIEKAGMIKSVSGFGKCYVQLIREFISNLTLDVAMPGSENFHKVCVRGRWILFSPEFINSALDRSDNFYENVEPELNVVAKEISAGAVHEWPAKKLLSSGLLSVKYAILSRIGMLNWIPSNHTSAISVSLARLIYWIGTATPFDFGLFVFEQTMKHAESVAVKLPISFPSLLSDMMLKQHPDLLLSSDVALPKGPVITLDHRLFQSPHVLDIVLPESRTSVTLSASGTKSTLAEMEELSKELQEVIKATTARKAKVDALICKLKKENESADGSSSESEDSEKVVSVESKSSSDATNEVATDVEDIPVKDSEGKHADNSE